MKRRKKALKIGGALLVLVFLLGCAKGIVCDYGYDADSRRFTISVQDDVDDGSGGTKIKKVDVNEGQMVSCQIGDEWPVCGEGVEDPFPNSGPVNAKYVSLKYHDNNRMRMVCVNSVSMPRVRIINSWTIGNSSKVEDPATQGIFEVCENALSGSIATLKSEHINKPSSLMCTIWWWDPKQGKKRILDWAMTQTLGDCNVRAKIP